MYSIIEVKGKQYKAEPGKKMKVDFLGEDQNGKDFSDYNVLLYSDDEGNVKVGTPYLENISLKAKVVGDLKAKKIKVVKYKSKITYTKTSGHRQKYTEVMVDAING